MERKSWKKTLLVFAAVQIFIFLVLFPVLAQFYYPATGALELWLAERMLDGQIPYHDFSSEYPPLALLSFLLPGLIFDNTITYSWGFAFEFLLFDLLILLMLYDLASFFNIQPRTMLAVYTLIIIATGPILVCRYDLLPAMLVLGALWAFIKGKNKLAWAAIAMGFAAKLYPVIIIPFFMIYQLRHGQFKRLVEGGAVFLGVTALFILPWVVIDAPGYLESWTYHLERGLHSESTYGTALLAGQVLGITSMEGILNYGSWNLISPLADSLAKVSFYISAVSLIAVYGLFAWNSRRDVNESGEKALSRPAAITLIQYTTLAVIVFMVTNKVFSAQYMVWLCPLLPLVIGEKRYLVAGLFLVAAVFTQYVYPYDYGGFERGQALPVFALFFRNLLLIAAAFLIALHNKEKGAGYQSPGTRALRPGG
jgi:uncharacterized membrane protein